MELEVSRTRDGGFKPSILPERKRVTFLLDDLIRAMFITGVSARRLRYFGVIQEVFGK